MDITIIKNNKEIYSVLGKDNLKDKMQILQSIMSHNNLECR